VSTKLGEDQSDDSGRQTNHRTKASEHIDERLGAKEVDTSTQEIADARLRHAQRLGGSPLLETVGSGVWPEY
jgi:hypothetical protein